MDVDRFIFIVTETNGLPRVNDYRDVEFPRLLCLGWGICDSNFEPLSYDEYLVSPCGFYVSPNITKINGISDSLLRSNGYPLKSVLDRFLSGLVYPHGLMFNNIVGHNVDFHINVLLSEYYRLGYSTDVISYISSTNRMCTCSIGEETYGRKFRLHDLYSRIYGKELISNSVKSKVGACMRIYQRLRKDITVSI